MRLRFWLSAAGWAAAVTTSPLASQMKPGPLDCSGLKLYKASGVPQGPTRAYAFRGTCKASAMGTTAAAMGGASGTFGSPWVEVKLVWDSKSALLTNSVNLSGATAGVTGNVQLVFKCNADPVLEPASCVSVKFADQTGWPGFTFYRDKGQPISGAATLAEAAALSKAGGAVPPPPPPAPKKADPIADLLAKGFVEIPLAPGVSIPLQNLRALAARPIASSRGLFWQIIGTPETVLQTFPAGARAFRNAAGDVAVTADGTKISIVGKAVPVRVAAPTRAPATRRRP